MVTHRSALRLALNIGLDGVLAALAVPLSRWLIQPTGDPFTPVWTIAWGAVALGFYVAFIALSVYRSRH